MKHAYLIITHNEFEVLNKLLQAIDDERNDIYIHLDRKVKQIPLLHTSRAGLYVLNNRIDVHWGHISQIQAEYALFEAAQKKERYRYYHLISGTHLPLYSQDYIHRFFNGVQNREVLADMPTSDYEINMKLQRYNFFMKTYFHPCSFVKRSSQLLWVAALKIQRILHISRYKNQSFTKASNWVSITDNCVDFLLSMKKEILKKYRFSMCGDEFFIPSTLESSSVKWDVLFCDKLLKVDIGKSKSHFYHLEDYEDLINSHCLFARKFGREDMAVVDKILDHIKSMQ
ncbi:MAG: glycosyl transferase [Dysgonamonadaceae bacterium]|jgi:hypothetical protein|nr:glycosyl transferase [Dysgonamonadaceae bacterium]